MPEGWVFRDVPAGFMESDSAGLGILSGGMLCRISLGGFIPGFSRGILSRILSRIFFQDFFPGFSSRIFFRDFLRDF